MSVYEESVSE